MRALGGFFLFLFLGVLISCGNYNRNDRGFAGSTSPELSNTINNECQTSLIFPVGISPHHVNGNRDCSHLELPLGNYIENLSAQLLETEFFQANCEQIQSGFAARKLHLKLIEEINLKLKADLSIEERRDYLLALEQQYVLLNSIYNERNLGVFASKAGALLISAVLKENIILKLKQLNSRKQISLSGKNTELILVNPQDKIFNQDITACFQSQYCEISAANLCTAINQSIEIKVEELSSGFSKQFKIQMVN